MCVCVCVSAALAIQHVMRMRHIGLPLSYFSTLYHKRYDFREKVIVHKVCVLTSSTTFVWNISHYKQNSVRHCHECKAPVTLVRLQWNLNFLDRFSENTRIPRFTKIRPLWAELFHGDRQTSGRTHTTKLTVTFRGFFNEPKDVRRVTGTFSTPRKLSIYNTKSCEYWHFNIIWTHEKTRQWCVWESFCMGFIFV